MRGVGLVGRLTGRLRGRPRRGRRGVNVIGYLDAPSGLGERARELVATLREGGVDVSEWTVPSSGAAGAAGAAARVGPVYDTTIAVVTAVQMSTARELLPEPFERAEWVIGYFFWELAEVPDEQQWGIGLVDEIWAPTHFVRDAYDSATSTPVRLVPLPVAPPATADADPTDADESVVFVTSFDFSSSVERKNPAGVIEAFGRAFPLGSDDADRYRLVVKSVNGAQHPVELAQLQADVSTDDRIEIIDQVMSSSDLAALVHGATALVSLHRAEGLGLHIAQAMWLGTPVVATAYSGSLDLTGATPGEFAELVSADVIAVAGGGEAYGSGVWADPDLDEAAAAMRRLATDPEHRAAVAARARAHIEEQFDRDAVAARISSLLWAGQ
jgi:glycosyltransferase involved in cell wall biosynthesis